MGSIPGPIITFRIDAPQLAGATQGAFQEVKNQARQTSAQIADDWKRMAARIRADAAQGVLTTKQEADARSVVVSRLELQIRAMNRLSELNTKQLAQYKAMTLELERQKSHLSGTGGLTAGTHAAIGQLGTQTFLGVTRALDSIVNRYFGGAAGSLFRTARDLSYYSSIGAGGATGEGGATSGIFSKLSSPLGLSLLGATGAVVGLTTALGVLAVKGGNVAVELEDMAHKTGLTVENAIKLKSASEVLGTDFDSTAIGFKKFSKEIVEAGEGNKQAAAIFRDLGVDVKKAATDPYSAIQQLSKALNTIPDGALKTAVATELFGRGGQQLLPVLADLQKVTDLTKQSSEDLARALGVDVKDSAIAMKSAVVNWKNETDALEVAIAQHLLPTLVQVVGIINDSFSGKEIKINNTGDFQGYLKSLGVQLTPYGASEFRHFNANNPQIKDAKPFQEFNAFFGWESAHGVTASKLIEQYKDAVSQSGSAAKEASVNIKQLGHDAVAGSKAAKDAQAEFWKSVGEQIYRQGYPGSNARQEFYRAGLFPNGLGLNAGLGKGPVTDFLNSIGYTGYTANAPGFGSQYVRLPGGSPYATPAALGLGTGLESQTGNLLAGVGIGPVGVGVSTGATQQDILKAILGGDYDKIFNTKEQQYHEELAQLKNALDSQLIDREQYNQAVLSINDDLHKEMMRQNEEFNHQADELFNQLINSNRNFGRTLVKDLRDSMLAPIRNAFDQIVGGLLGGFSRATTAGFNGTVGAIPGLSRFATVPFLGSLIPGLGGKAAAPTGTAGDPVHVVFGTGTATGAVGVSGGAGGVLGGILGILGLGGGGGFASALSGTGLSIGANGLIGGSLPLGTNSAAASLFGSGGSGSGGILGALKGLVGFGGKNGGFSLSGGLSSLGIIGGGLLTGLGASTGGALGGLEGALGGGLSGSLTGLEMGGPIGAAIGGIIGGIGGLISGIIGPSFQQKVRNAMVNQAYYAPPSETFSFASNGSISNTLSTGFSQSGGRFSQFGLPNNTPFYASALTGPLSYSQWLALQNENNLTNTGQPFLGFPSTNPYLGQGPVGSHATTPAPAVNVNISAVDAKGVSDFFNEHGTTIAAIINSKSPMGATGTGRTVRTLAFPP